jgi:hypothetical protein
MTNTNGSFADLLRVALYLGVSRDDQAKHGYSVDDQRRELRHQAFPLPPVARHVPDPLAAMDARLAQAPGIRAVVKVYG